MKPSPLVSALVLFGLPSASSAADSSSDVIAVFDVETSGVVLKKGEIEGLSEYLFQKMASVPSFKLVPRAEVRKRLLEAKKESYKECYDQSCQIELGRELAAQKTLSAKILKLGDECSVSLVIYDLRTAATDAAADASGGCTTGALARVIESAVGTLAKPKLVAVAAVAPQMGVVDTTYCPEKGTRRMGDPPPKGQAVYCMNEQNQMHGPMVSWHTTGKIAMKTDYKNGQMHGHQAIYHRNGAVLMEGDNADGKKVGPWITYTDEGIKLEEGPYLNGMKQGLFISYDPYGKKTRETEYRDDVREGKDSEFFPNGKVRATGTYSADKESGVFSYYADTGKKTEEKSYKSGRLHGPSIELDANGHKTELSTYVNGQREGPYEEWALGKDGAYTLRVKGNYKENQRDGAWYRMKADGTVEREEKWAAGQRVEDK